MLTDKTYIGTKIIQAISMDELTFLKTVKNQVVENRENQHGYKVTYPDGYVSWSPKNVFETAYREITTSEKALI